MTPEEHDLISSLFERMRAMGKVETDRDAEALIAERVRATPDATYMLVQSVLMQEQALQQAGARIEDLERQLREREQNRSTRPAAGGFLGGFLGGGRDGAERVPERAGSSVPVVGSRAGYGTRPGSSATARAWESAASEQAGQRGGSGSFLQSAMATAAGVTGGMLLANSIRGMLGPDAAGKAHAHGTGETAATAAQPQPAQDAAATNAGHENTSDHASQPQQADHTGADDADHLDDASWDDAGGGFFDDIDI